MGEGGKTFFEFKLGGEVVSLDQSSGRHEIGIFFSTGGKAS